MGNRAVITTRECFENDGIGIYVHWNGGRDSVEGFLKYCELKNYMSPSDDETYGFARLTQVIANFFGGTHSIGVGKLRRLDCENFDNGVYIIDGWKIVGREYFENGCEQNEYELIDVIREINQRQPEAEMLEDETIEEEFKEEE